NGATDLGALMSNLNRLIYDASPINHFATFFYGQYETATRRLTYVNAGHNPPMLLRGAEVIRLEAGGTVIGSWPSVAYEQRTLELKPGDLLVVFTDGITEAMNAAEEEFGEQRLAQVVEGARDLPVGDVIRRILDAVDAFAAGEQQYDDLTLVVLRARPA
ncbi:MAG: PP2C family protein-serine/threonine phosphatase, partial [Acidobacteria bacterium]|nr:PP2C family protein-serine/threonine phosphatase [Acidobacteriota bacterium]